MVLYVRLFFIIIMFLHALLIYVAIVIDWMYYAIFNEIKVYVLFVLRKEVHI